MPATPEDLPSVLPLDCPTCGEETDHTVLKGTLGLRGDYKLDAVVRCERCATTRHVLHREPGEREVPVIVSHGAESRRAKMLLGDDEDVEIGNELLVDGERVLVTGIEDTKGLRVDAASVPEVGTLWVKAFENVVVGFTINLGKKTIAKDLVMEPEDTLSVGEERTFGNLRVTIHGIKAGGRMLRRGSAEARDIARVFAKPTRDDDSSSRPRRTAPRDIRRTQQRPPPKGSRGRGQR